MSWLFSQALVAEYSAANCLDGEPYAQLNVMPTQAKFWRNDKTMEFSKLSQFGLTLQLLTESRGEALLTWYLAGFHAKTSAQQEKAQELKAQEAECGKKWHGLLAKYDPLTHSWKTAQCSLLEDLELCLQTWPRWGSMRNGACYLRPMLVQTIKEKESGLWPNNETFFHTPNTTGLDGGSNGRKALKKRAETPSGNWPTPTCSDVMTGNLKSTQQKPGSMHSVTLPQAVAMWPTPVARMHKDCAAPSEYKRNEVPLAAQVGGQLNPTWVEWLMGWPLEWTDLKPLATDKCHCAPQQHLNCLETELKSEAA